MSDAASPGASTRPPRRELPQPRYADQPPDGAGAWKRRMVVAAILAVLPGKARIALGRRLLGWEIDPTARIGPSIVAARHVVLGPGAAIGPLNMIKGIDELQLGPGTYIGAFNWITSSPRGSGLFPASPRRYPALLMGEGAAIIHRHFLDCSDTITLGAFFIIGGIRSAIFTHSIDIVRNRQRTNPVVLGEYAGTGTHCVVLGGTAIPPCSVVAAGSVVTTILTKEYTYYSGNPAAATRDLPEHLAIFNRTDAYIE